MNQLKLVITIFTTILFVNNVNAAEQQTTIVHAGTLLAIPGKMPKQQQSLIIRDGKIIEVVEGYVSTNKYNTEGTVKVIDLKNKFVMPGMMDMHVHLTVRGGPVFDDLMKTSDSDFAIVAVESARKTLMAGITTVRDVAAVNGEPIIAVRDAIKRGAIPGPRVIAAGMAISATAGHGDFHRLTREDIAEISLSSGVCDGPADCRRAVRAQYKIGADMIKIMATGGGADQNGKAESAPEMFDDELKAIVETAHRLNLKVTAHAHGTAGINAALKAGVDSVDHSSWIDDESIKLYRKTGAYMISTLSLQKFFKQVRELSEGTNQARKLSERAKQAMEARAKKLRDLRARAYKKGVKFAMGTDAGISYHGKNAEELVSYVEIGMTPMEAIQTATVNTADLMGLSDEIGTLETGKSADIIAMDISPLEDITAVRNVTYVMRNGIIYKNQ